MRYRVNYGNGQVSNTVNSVKAAQREIDALPTYQGIARIEVYIPGSADCPGEWFTVRKERA